MTVEGKVPAVDSPQFLNVSRIHPKDVLKKQFVNDRFVRWDTVIRCLATEHFLKTGSIHYFYNKDCYHRHIRLGGIFSRYARVQKLSNFKSLVEMYVKDSDVYNDEYPIIVDSRGVLYDGTHRLGISLALKFPYIEVSKLDVVLNQGIELFTLDYYKEIFSEGELELMLDTYDRLMETGE